ncbi:WD40 repeat-like protein [Tilletiaria anomala UBC 951]|uniref:Glutamate-rich WD repeat-containing protein 1 n=1 Tax=Tilletiaria anomala (strain ATCC 24038 / CBS 436.72 / UBC 951) TaxID=1037660 RepID=A0A066VH97_TILAU|nr:WD40 repeat-like protein [Tilletiaria anomala UBC 951]KDN37940.1 WD40 repeat-like protein [Tilletiaria anomala UBC 951]
MSKRAASPSRASGKAPSSPEPSSSAGGGPSKRVASGKAKQPEEAGADTAPEGMGEFEDAFEDEIEDEEYDDDGEAVADDEEMSVDGEIERLDDDDLETEKTRVYLPSAHAEGEKVELEPDQTAYEMLHRLNVTWPCLSFDILRDGLGVERGTGSGSSGFPHTAYFVAGTQADQPKNNEVLVMKASSMYRTSKDGDLSDDENDDEDDDLDEDAVLEYRSIPILGGVNRVRAAPVSSPTSAVSSEQVLDPYPIAVWSELGKVHIYDIRPLFSSLDRAGTVDKKTVSTPLHTVDAHAGVEGYALDWAGSTPASLQTTGAKSSTLRLLSGDVHSKIYLTTTSNSGYVTHPSAFISHTSSVEDLQWSPTEQTVFASCSADQSIRIWDVRVKSRKSVLSVERAHDMDVNVIAWNKKTEYLLLSGGDEGGLKVWDMRTFKSGTGTAGKAAKPDPVAAFQWHTAPISSVEWHPSEESVFAASGRDDQVTLWDLSVEADDEETGLGGNSAEMKGPDGKEVPNQLLFCHHGASEIKEVHWHPQIPGMLISTSADGFHLFKTISV